MVAQSFDKAVITSERTGLHFLNPAGQAALTFEVGLRLIENGGQFLAEGIGEMALRCQPKEPP